LRRSAGEEAFEIPEQGLVFGEAELIARGGGVRGAEAVENLVLLDEEISDAGAAAEADIGFGKGVIAPQVHLIVLLAEARGGATENIVGVVRRKAALHGREAGENEVGYVLRNAAFGECLCDFDGLRRQRLLAVRIGLGGGEEEGEDAVYLGGLGGVVANDRMGGCGRNGKRTGKLAGEGKR